MITAVDSILMDLFRADLKFGDASAGRLLRTNEVIQ